MSDKIIIVSGGTGNLGKAVVDRLSAQECKIYLPVRDVAKFRKMYDNSSDESAEYTSRKVYAMECDLKSFEKINKFVDTVATLEQGRIDAVLNIAGGIHPPKAITEIDENFFDEYFKLNFESSMYLSVCALKYMRKNMYGRIVLTGAIAGLEPVKEKFVYSVSKAALINLMESINLEMKDYNIRCNMIVPSVLDTSENRSWATEDEIKNFVSTSEVAEIISDIISDKYNSLNQSILKITGNY